MPEEPVQQVETEIIEEPARQVMFSPLEEFTKQVVQVIEEQAAAQSAPSPKKKNHPARPMPQAREQFDLNQVVLSGVIRSVWGKNNDVFARLALSHRGRLVENDDTFASYVTLRFADGMIGGQPITIQAGDVLKIQGYTSRGHKLRFLKDLKMDSLPTWC